MADRNKELVKIIGDKATAICFLNVNWLDTLANELKENGLLTESFERLANHAKNENRQAFQEINEITKSVDVD